MNTKNVTPLIVALPALVEIAAAVPPLIIGAAIGYGAYRLVKWLDMDNCLAEFLGLADDDKEHLRNEVASTPTPRESTSAAPAAPPRPALVIPSVSGGNSVQPVQNPSIPQHSGGKPNTPSTPSASAPAVSASAYVRANSSPIPPEIPVPPPSAIPAMKIAAQSTLPPPIKKKFVTREDVATVFQRGARAQTRTAAVAALKSLGFGKTAAYDALLENGRFSAWLRFAPDGIITWTAC